MDVNGVFIPTYNWGAPSYVIPNVLVSWDWERQSWWIETTKDQIQMDGFGHWSVMIVILASWVDEVSHGPTAPRPHSSYKQRGWNRMPEVRVREEGDHLQTRRRGPKTNETKLGKMIRTQNMIELKERASAASGFWGRAIDDFVWGPGAGTQQNLRSCF